MAFTARTFAVSEPTSVALGLSKCDLITTFHDVITKSVCSGFSFAIEDQFGEIIAQSLSLPYETFASASYGHIRESAPLFDLFSQLDTYIPPKDSIYMFAISSDVGGVGLGSALLATTIEAAGRNGYATVLGDCTNYKSQSLFKKQGFASIVEINYKNFEYGVSKPFESIVDTRGICRMVRHDVDEVVEAMSA
jgi:GNAT superfamily N-acetyltransferase